MPHVSLYTPHPVQLQVHQSPARFKVVNFGRRCLAADMLVWTARGLVEIKDVVVGDQVWSFNGQDHDLKQVLATFEYSVDTDPKPMLYFTYENEKYKSTYDHPYYSHGQYVPLYQLVWRNLEASQRQALELFCEQYGQTIDYQSPWLREDGVDAPGDGRLRLSTNSDGGSDSEGAQGGGRSLGTKSSGQAPSQSQERNQDGQPSREPGVDDPERKPRPCCAQQPSGQELRGEERFSEDYRETGPIDYTDASCLLRLWVSEEDSEKDGSKLSHCLRHQTWEDLEVHPSETTYCIEVADNHNFYIGHAALLVHNTGKSTLAQNYILAPNAVADWAVKGALQDVGRYWIIAPTYTQAKSIYWRGLMFSKDPSDTTAIPKNLIAKVNESELIVTLINGSTIELKGSDNPDSLRGAGIKGVVLDEYAFWNDPTAWEYVIQPALSDSGGWAVFISTPNGFNHFYELAVHAQTHPNWSYHHATIWDNPNIAEEEKLRLQSELDEDTWAQEYLGEFRKMKGLVYPEFDKSIHVLPESFSLPLGGTWAMGVDPGTSNALAAGFFFIDFDNNWYLTDEVYERGLTTEQVYNRLRAKMGSNYFSVKIADSAAAQFILDMNSIHNLGIEGVKKERDSIQEGIRLNRELLKTQEGTGKPKFFVMPHCRNFIREIESYRYPESKPGQNDREDPIKENDHLMDAWRYVRLSLHMPNRKPVARREKTYDPVTGRAIGFK